MQLVDPSVLCFREILSHCSCRNFAFKECWWMRPSAGPSICLCNPILISENGHSSEVLRRCSTEGFWDNSEHFISRHHTFKHNFGMKLDLICSNADGIEPAVLISAEGNDRSQVPISNHYCLLLFVPETQTDITIDLCFQYLFNAPEGLSRVLLEHKMRPSAMLKSIFSTSAMAIVRPLHCCLRAEMSLHVLLHRYGQCHDADVN